jgi:chromosome segregation ATPase
MSSAGGADTGIIAEQLLRERERAEELNNRLKQSSKDVAESNNRESELRSDLGRKEKDFALVKHELKEMQRRAEVDSDLKKKAESERAEIRKRLEDEMNKRTREQNNNHHVAEKIANLEKEKRELSEKLKKELENVEKVKKANNETSVAKVAALSVVSDLNDKMGLLSEDRNVLERETAKMQSQLQIEKNLRNEAAEHIKDLEGREGRL